MVGLSRTLQAMGMNGDGGIEFATGELANWHTVSTRTTIRVPQAPSSKNKYESRARDYSKRDYEMIVGFNRWAIVHPTIRGVLKGPP